MKKYCSILFFVFMASCQHSNNTEFIIDKSTRDISCNQIAVLLSNKKQTDSIFYLALSDTILCNQSSFLIIKHDEDTVAIFKKGHVAIKDSLETIKSLIIALHYQMPNHK